MKSGKRGCVYYDTPSFIACKARITCRNKKTNPPFKGQGGAYICCLIASDGYGWTQTIKKSFCCSTVLAES